MNLTGRKPKRPNGSGICTSAPASNSTKPGTGIHECEESKTFLTMISSIRPRAFKSAHSEGGAVILAIEPCHRPARHGLTESRSAEEFFFRYFPWV